MFKELKIVKLLILAISAFLVFPFEFHHDFSLETGYAQPHSAINNLNFYLSGQGYSKKNKYHIFDVDRKVKDSLIAPIFKQHIPHREAWKGYHFRRTFSYSIPGEMEGGLYYLENFIPFLVRGKTIEKVAVIYPLMTYQAQNDAGGRRLIEMGNNAANMVSLNRPHKPGTYTSNLFSFFKKEKIKVNYYYDLELETFSLMENHQLLILYGSAPLWTEKAKKNLRKFVKNGGNLLILSDNILRKKNLLFDQDNQLISFANEYYNSWAITGSHITPPSSTPLDFMVADNSHFLLQGTGLKENETITISSRYFSGLLIDSLPKDSMPMVNHSIKRLYDLQIAAYVPVTDQWLGIIASYRIAEDSGLIINMGSKNWCKKEFLDNGLHSTIIKNAITRGKRIK